MSAKPFASLLAALREATMEAVWIQWQAMGGQAAADRRPSAIVDPEALVLASLWLADEETRLRDFLVGFAEVNPRLLSVQRLKQALRIFPPGTEGRLAGFAAWVAQFGKDPRWRSLSSLSPQPLGRRGKVGPASVSLGEPASLLIRLRTGLGVDVRTDTLAYLIGRQDAWADVKEISEALVYAKYSVRTACEALADARLIASHAGRPVRYYADQDRWRTLLELTVTPRWHSWMAVYAFTTRLDIWLQAPSHDVSSPRLVASLARELLFEHGAILRDLQLDVPDDRDFPGENYLEAFDRTVRALVQWLRESV